MSLQEEVTTENDISEVPAASSHNNSTVYDRKRQSKAIRVLTVLAYILSVSLAAIFLSIYYIFVWDGQSTLAAKGFPQAQIALGATQKPFQETSAASVGSENTTESFKRLYTKRDVFENHSIKSFGQTATTGRPNSNGNHDISINGPTTEGLLTSNSSGLDDFQIGLPEPTMEFEDSTPFSMVSTEENSTWLPEELNDYNAEFSEFNKRSVFMKKLFGRQNMIPK